MKKVGMIFLKIVTFPVVALGFLLFLMIYAVCRSEGLSREDSINVARIR